MTVVRDLFKYSASFRVGAILLAIMLLVAGLSFFSPYAPDDRRVVPKDKPPSAQYPLGTTSLGQDVFWQLTFTVRNSLIIAGLAVVIGRSIALVLGTVSGYLGGTPDRVLSGFADAFIVIPRLPLLLLISYILKDKLDLVSMGILLGLLDWAWPSKRYRAQILTLREEEFTQTAVFSGTSTLKVILREHFPFLIPFTLADAVSGFLWAIGMEITLSILGVSDLATPTIGTMIYWANYYQAMLARKFWWLAAPIIASILIVIAFYLISISLSEYLDPRTRLKRMVVAAE
jgi:peptide/nickel transport system permease protein